MAAVAAWEWSAGHYPLPVPEPITWQRIADFEANARPEWHGRSVSEWRDELARRDAEMAELKRKAEAAEEQLHAERARNGHGQEARRRIRSPQEQAALPVIAGIVVSPLGVLVGRRIDGTPPWTFIAGMSEPGEIPGRRDRAARSRRRRA